MIHCADETSVIPIHKRNRAERDMKYKLRKGGLLRSLLLKLEYALPHEGMVEYRGRYRSHFQRILLENYLYYLYLESVGE